MKFAGLTIILFAVSLFHACGPVDQGMSRELAEIIDRKLLAQRTTQSARELARDLEKAQAARDFPKLAELEAQSRRQIQDMDQLMREIEERQERVEAPDTATPHAA